MWMNASSKDKLEASCNDLLPLPGTLNGVQVVVESNSTQDLVTTIKNWLEENSDWLLILDKCSDLNLVEDFIPREPKGHILLTTRVHTAPKWTTIIELGGLAPNEGASFLLY